ncbi:defensin Ec-AMP-D2-like [Sesamum indicum]|uniref:Defensin Ec-AMP-D2-like n=1 Tax=Sesamum indicum TaxID=4182 RepID=A0A6I9STN5_SESIN|nr:defensin Ec-AMP-D2-like [Sesamum indicum]
MMKYSKLFTVAAVLLLLQILLIHETEGNSSADAGVKVEEKKLCTYKSEKFWGVCLSDISCADVCKREGFEGGDCQGFRRRCYCYNHCK